MLKKCLFVMVLMSVTALTVAADTPADPNHSGVIKIDGSNFDDPGYQWPAGAGFPNVTSACWPGFWTYQPLCICQIPVTLKAGMWIKLVDCNKKKIVLSQVDCSTIGKGTGDYPCYSNCISLTFQSNFPFKLGSSISVTGSILSASKMSVTYTPNTLPAGQNTTQMCVTAWQANLMTATACTEVDVAQICVTVVPNFVQ